MIENWFGLIVIAGAAYYAKDKRIQLVMIGTILMVELVTLVIPITPDSPWFDAYYMAISTVIAIPACICITLIYTRSSHILAIILSVQAIVNAAMFLDLDAVYFIHESINDKILLVEIGLAWYAAAESRKGYG